jgi:glucose-6-phosphate isomerase
MALLSQNPTNLKTWSLLEAHFNEIKDQSMSDWFKKNSDRAEELTLVWEDFYVDYSKNRITTETIALFKQMAEEINLKDAISKYFSGDLINETEHRAVLHTALRAAPGTSVEFEGTDIIPEIQKVKSKIKSFSDAVISGQRKGYTGKPFTDVVNIGIGGSDLGPAMVVDALSFYKNHLTPHFVSNVDGDHVNEILKKLNPETTLFIIVSKTFTTQETLSNATTIKNWFLERAQLSDVAKHFVAVSTNTTAVHNFGIDPSNIFPMWDWVGGRFSLWSAVGISISLAVGYSHFEDLLGGAFEMDTHFKTAKFDQNIPVVSAMLSVWYNNFFGAQTEAIIPYTQYLNQFATYLQQAIMESNGKSTDRDGNRINYQTGNIVWGEPGTNAQHAFFQLIHQGTKLIPADFIGFAKSLHGNVAHQDKLMSNFFAQTEALLNGKTTVQVSTEFKNNNITSNRAKQLTPFKVFEGNKPTTTIFIDKLTPNSLGKLIAMYEHKIFVQGVIWNVFSYDQFGVELGKQLAGNILKEFNGTAKTHDSSTENLIKRYQESK